jgi:hypothetical protein
MPIISFSELDTYRQCTFKHQLAYGERWVAPVDSPALDRGKRVHTILETWYGSLRSGWRGDIDEVIRSCEGTVYDHNGEFIDEMGELVKWIVEGYVEHYGFDEDWKVIEVEHDFVLPLPKPDGKNSNIKIKGKIDLLVEWKGKLWVVDHKTAARLPTDKELDLDVQFSIYAWALRKLGYPVHGMIYNTLRTQRNKGEMVMTERFSRTLIAKSDAELTRVAQDAYQDAYEAYAGIRKSNKTGVDRPRHFNTDTCRWRCPYTEACLFGAKDGRGGTRGYLAETGFVQNFTRH